MYQARKVGSHIYIIGCIDFISVSTIFQLDFRIVPTVWYFFVFPFSCKLIHIFYTIPYFSIVASISICSGKVGDNCVYGCCETLCVCLLYIFDGKYRCFIVDILYRNQNVSIRIMNAIENLCSQVEKRFTLFIIWVLKKKKKLKTYTNRSFAYSRIDS